MSRIKLLTFVMKKDAIDKLLVFQMVGILGGEEGGVEEVVFIFLFNFFWGGGGLLGFKGFVLVQKVCVKIHTLPY